MSEFLYVVEVKLENGDTKKLELELKSSNVSMEIDGHLEFDKHLKDWASVSFYKKKDEDLLNRKEKLSDIIEEEEVQENA